MRKLNKQDLLFIGKILIFISVTFLVYLFIIQYFLLDNCNPRLAFAELSGYRCFGYLHFFDKVSIYFYILFLWITIVPFIRRKYLFSNMVYIIGILVLLGTIGWTYRITPIVSIDDIYIKDYRNSFQ